MAEAEKGHVIAMQGTAFYGKHSSELNDESKNWVITMKLSIKFSSRLFKPGARKSVKSPTSC